ncbi:MAG: hypothetical protein GX635_05130 [Synergistaceae bacterium]|nr:hypothetical protein [Synergistaceae bacterium]
MENLCSVSGKELASALGYDYDLWRATKGRHVLHKNYGHGQIVEVHKSPENGPLIDIVFPLTKIESQVNPLSFYCGFFPEVEIDSILLANAKEKKRDGPKEEARPFKPTTEDFSRIRQEIGLLIEAGEIKDLFDLVPVGEADSGGTASRERSIRRTHCWKCGFDGLDSSIHHLCSMCEGIVCPKCGACLCRYLTGAGF